MIVSRLRAAVENSNRFCDKLASYFVLQNKTFQNIFRVGLFVVLLHSLFVTVGVYKFLNNKPDSIHHSAQCQRASVALNYYKNDMNFFQPRIQRYLTDPGITGLEFPVIYYTAALYYKLFGFNDTVLKVISLLIVVVGLFAFYRLSLYYVRSSILVILITGTAFLSPVLLYYSANYLPDAPSMGLVLIAWYFFIKYLRFDNKRYFSYFVVIGTLAALIKSVAFMSLLVAGFLIFLDFFGVFKSATRKNLFTNKFSFIFQIGLGLLTVFVWYYYAHFLGKKYDNQSFALSPLMVDDSNGETVLTVIKNYWLFQYYAYEAYVLFACALITIILFFRKADKVLFFIVVGYVIGVTGYIYFFSYQFKDHDYYIIAALPLFFFLLLLFADIIYKLTTQYSRLIVVVLFVVVFFNMKESLIVCRDSYYQRHLFERTYLAGIDFRPYYDLQPKLREKGVLRTDKTLSLFDNSYCSTLYYMDQIGATVGDNPSRELIDSLLTKYDIKYVVVNDSAKLNKIYPNDFAKKVILEHRGLMVYKVK